MRWPELLFVVLLALGLGACASGGAPRKEADAGAREAAAVQVKLGRGYMEQGDLEVALERLQRAVQIDPRSVDAYTLLGVLHERIKRPAKAETFYRKAVHLAPDNGEVNNNLGAFLCGEGRYQEADVLFLKAIDDPFYRSVAPALANAGVCALKGGDETKAEGYFRRVLELEPQHTTALYELARLSYLHGDALRARAFLQRLEASVPAGPVMLDLGQRIETQIGDADAARRYRDRLHNEFPDYEPDASLEGPKPS